LKCEKEEREYKTKVVVRNTIFKEGKKFFMFLKFPGSAHLSPWYRNLLERVKLR
jgi:hypothetical protein